MLYKTTLEKLKKSIDFDEKICYYIFKERESERNLKTERSNTNGSLINAGKVLRGGR